MDFGTKEDIEAPIGFVFAQLSDFDGFERAAMRRGIEVRREGAAYGLGAKWAAQFAFRGKPRNADLEIIRFDPPNGFDLAFESGGIEGKSKIELVPLSPNRTRLMVQIELTPRTLAARLLMQSLKLAKASMTKKFKSRVADQAEEIEKRYAGGA